ncbi:ATP-binding protein [Pelomonas sp. KK5]|uniref:sensor histidine kinase n=1 Tax=Pelomonas sp. KK5 TaxID=1855730 RepID=UPI00097BB6AE|nr:ATP-binding protein [Pelomonas sp. KK5]
MNSLSDAGIATPRGPGRAAALLLGLTLGGLAGLVCMGLLLALQDGVQLSPGAVALTLIFSGVLLLGVAGLGWHAGVRLTRRRLGESLGEARRQVQLLSQLQPDWQWATDAGHHLRRWQAPQGAPSSAWAGGMMLAATQPLWERFELAEAGATLRERLEAGAAFAQLAVRATDGSGERWLLRGIACKDQHGRFTGFQGTARRLVEDRALPSGAAALIEEHAAFSYTVSHDLRAPLRVVEGFARILKEDYGGKLDRVGNDHLDRVAGAAGRMNGMIDALLSLARLSAQPLADEPLDLSALAAQVIDELRRATPERGVEVQLQQPLPVRGDPMLLRMLLDNLLGNAWKYTGKCEHPRVSLGCALGEDGRRVFCVRDNGAGFDMRFADRLFGAFQRLHSASDFPGTGVGLASVQRIVRRHGGEIWAESEPGQGARFYFTLEA